jgi:hypothetical protein
MDIIDSFKSWLSSINLIYYLFIGLTFFGFIFYKIFSFKNLFSKIKGFFENNSEQYIEPEVTNYLTIKKNLKSNNRESFRIACQYMNQHSRLPKDIQKLISMVILKEGIFKKKDWITQEIRFIAVNFLCVSIIKNHFIATNGKAFMINSHTCSRIDKIITK